MTKNYDFGHKNYFLSKSYRKFNSDHFGPQKNLKKMIKNDDFRPFLEFLSKSPILYEKIK
jgi:hypothetical protein